jgi:hypothetical protein
MICGLSRCPLPKISTREAPGKPWERVRGRASGRLWPCDQLGPALRALVTHQCAAGPAHQCLAASWKAPSPRSSRTRKRWLFAPRPSLIACQIRATRLVGVELRYCRSEEADVSVRQLHGSSRRRLYVALRQRNRWEPPSTDNSTSMRSCGFMLWYQHGGRPDPSGCAPLWRRRDPDEWVHPLCRGYRRAKNALSRRKQGFESPRERQ